MSQNKNNNRNRNNRNHKQQSEGFWTQPARVIPALILALFFLWLLRTGNSPALGFSNALDGIKSAPKQAMQLLNQQTPEEKLQEQQKAAEEKNAPLVVQVIDSLQKKPETVTYNLSHERYERKGAYEDYAEYAR